MNTHKCFIFIFFCLMSCCTYAQDSQKRDTLNVFNYWKYYDGMQQKSIYLHICNEAFRMLDKRQAEVSSLQDASAWRARQQQIREKLQEAIGSFPEKTPLNAVVTEKIKRKDMVVENLYYESRPGFYVTASLFIPNHRQKKAPGIVYCSGHSPLGYRSEYAQAQVYNLVKKGFVVLLFDPYGQGLRRENPNIGLTEGHSLSGAQSDLLGLSSANYVIWDGIRAVDYLISRKEVDPNRIGMTGRSGGGTQTAMIAAVDSRIKAAAPENYLTDFEMLMKSRGPQDGEQNLMYFIAKGLDMADFLVARAPLPTLMVTTSRDIFSAEGARRTFAEATKAFDNLGGHGALQMVMDDGEHVETVKNREAINAFFQKALGNPGSPKDLTPEPLTTEQLDMFHQNGKCNVFTELKSKTMNDLSVELAQRLHQQRQNMKGKSGDAFLSDLKDRVVKVTGYDAVSNGEERIFSGYYEHPDYMIEEYLVKGCGDYFLPVVRLVPKGAGGSQSVLYLDDNGKAKSVAEGSMPMQLLAQGKVVYIPDLSCIGELYPGYIPGGDSFTRGSSLNLWFAGMLTGKSVLGIRMNEITRLCHFIQKMDGTSVSIEGYAIGALGSELLHAAVIGNHFSSLTLVRPLASMESMVEQPNYHTLYMMSAAPGALAVYDLPDLVGYLTQQGLDIRMIHPVDATAKPINGYLQRFAADSFIDQGKCHVE